MLGSHNTFTYFPPKNPIFNLFKPLWKCQTKSIEEQYENGVRFFDVRLIWSNKKKYWEVGHGLVKVKGIYFKDGEELKKYMSKFPGSQYRVILERGNKERERFEEIFMSLKDNDPSLVDVIVKIPWQRLYRSPLYPKIVKDYCVRLFGWDVNKGFWHNIKKGNFHLSLTIKKWAKLHNPEINEELIKSDVLYFMDYV
jgi:hypothetical protein